MTRLVVLADTHMPARGRDLPEAVVHAIDRADMVVHLGDFTDTALADELERRATLIAVHGNNDAEELRRRYPARRDLVLNGRRIALIHGHVGGRSARQAARSVRGADIVLYGHSHIPSQECFGNALLFNPGSPTDRRQAPFRAFGVIDIDEAVTAKIVPL